MSDDIVKRARELAAGQCTATFKGRRCSFAYAHEGRHELWDGDPSDIVNRVLFWFDEFLGATPDRREERESLSKLADECERLRAALEKIDDEGCNSKYGPGCDTECRRIAFAALTAKEDERG